MKTQTQFKNASLVSVVNGIIVVKSAAGIEHTFTNASVVSVNNGTIIIESEWKPKKGELVKVEGDGIDCFVIFHSKAGAALHTYGDKEISGPWYNFKFHIWACYNVKFSPVTPEEQKEFDDFCKSQGKIWNKETLQWEKYRWKPERGEEYYMVDLEHQSSVGSHLWNNDTIDNANYNAYNCFQTREQAKKAAEKVKELLKSL